MVKVKTKEDLILTCKKTNDSITVSAGTELVVIESYSRKIMVGIEGTNYTRLIYGELVEL